MSRNKEDKKRGAVISAVIIIVVLAVFVGFILFPLISEMGGVFFAVMLLMLYVVGILAVIFGILAALKQRLEEIEGGEEEEAKKY
jgi:MFS family permease